MCWGEESSSWWASVSYLVSRPDDRPDDGPDHLEVDSVCVDPDGLVLWVMAVGLKLDGSGLGVTEPLDDDFVADPGDDEFPIAGLRVSSHGEDVP